MRSEQAEERACRTGVRRVLVVGASRSGLAAAAALAKVGVRLCSPTAVAQRICPTSQMPRSPGPAFCLVLKVNGNLRVLIW